MSTANIDRIDLSVRIRYPILITGSVITIAVAVLYGVFSSSTDFKTILEIVGSGIALTGLLYTAINLHVLNDSQRTSLLRESKNQARQLIDQWESMELHTTVSQKLRKKVAEGKLPAEAVDAALKEINQDSDVVIQRGLDASLELR